MPSKDDPFEFDQFYDIAPEPAPKVRPKVTPRESNEPSAGLDAGALFAEEDISAEREPDYEQPARRPEATKAKALQLDFTDVLGSEREMRGAQRIGGATLETDEFMSRKDREAIERAKTVPSGSLPSTLELEERSAGVRVVHDSKRQFWFLAVVMIVLPLLVIGAGVAVFIRYQQAKNEREIQELIQSDALHRKAQETHEQQLLH